MTTMNTSKLYNLLLTAETDGERATDSRRVLSAERQSLGIAIDRVKSADRAVRQAEGIRYSSEREPAVAAAKRARSEAEGRLVAVAAEARRVAGMWGVL